MSAIGSSTCTVVVDRSARTIKHSGVNWYTQAVTATVSGFGAAVAANLALLFYRNIAGVMTNVANGGTMVASGSNAVATIQTYTAGLATVFTGVKVGAIRVLDMLLYDGDSLELLGTGWFNLRSTAYTHPSDASAAAAVTPITGTTVVWGNLAKSGSTIYGKNEDDGLWYPVTFHGAGADIHLNLGETGIVITA